MVPNVASDCPYLIDTSVYINVSLQKINHVRVDKKKGDNVMVLWADRLIATMKDDDQGRKQISFSSHRSFNIF